MAAASNSEEPTPSPAATLTPNERFFRHFQHEVADIEAKIDRLANHGTSGGERSDAVDHCLASIARLSDEVKDAGSHLPAYDQRTYGEAIKALTSRLHEIRAAFAPRPKFAFKSGSIFTAKKNESAISLNDAATLAHERRRLRPGLGSGSDQSNSSSFATTPIHLQSPAPERLDNEDDANDGQHDPAARTTTGYNGDHLDQQAPTTNPNPSIRHPSFSQSTSVSISNHDGIHIVLPTSAAHATTTTGTLANLHRCVVDLSPPSATAAADHATRGFAGLTLRNISQSLVVCGRVAGPAHVTRADRAVLVVAARQFRMHESRHCDVYLLCASRPILEDCVGIRFAALPATYAATIPEAAGAAGGGDGSRFRPDVDDFNWLRAGEPSPNWRLLTAEETVREEVWGDVVPGGPGLGTEDVLRAVRLPVG